MKIKALICFLMIGLCLGWGQITPIPTVDNLELSSFEKGKIHKVWLALGYDSFDNPIQVPVMIAKGSDEGQVLGLTAAIHGNELNGIAIIHQLFSRIDISKMKGTIIAIPGLNPLAIASQQREFIDQQDLNRLFPGKENGNRSQQMAFQIGKKIIPHFHYHIDLHTASFGRENTLYGRGDVSDTILFDMLRILEPDIIVSNRGTASFGEASGLTMRAYALNNGVKSITAEYGNPQVFQQEMIDRGVTGIEQLLMWLGFTEGEITIPAAKNVCSRSFWIFTKKGGYLEIHVALNQKMQKGEHLATLRNAFGEVIEEYYAPEAGIVIGKSINPTTISGGRIVHLGILEKSP